MKVVCLLFITVFAVFSPLYGQDVADNPRMDRIKEMVSSRQDDRTAEGATIQSLPAEPGIGAGRMIQGLALILGVFFVGVYLYQRFSGRSGKPVGGRRIKILDRAPLTSKSSLVLARVDNREVLLAVGSDNVTFCRELIVDEMDQELERVCEQEDGGSSSL